MQLPFGSLLVFSILYAARALTLEFPRSLVAVDENSFRWTRDDKDPQDFYVIKKKLDDPSGPTGPSEHVEVKVNGASKGSGTIRFRRAGFFQVLAFDKQDQKSQKPLFATNVTVFLNPTSAGALPTNTAPAQGNSSGDSDSGGENKGKGDRKWKDKWKDKDGKKEMMASQTLPSSVSPTSTETRPANENHPNVPLIVGSTLGAVGVILMVAAALLCFRYKRRNQTLAFERNMIIRSPRIALPPRLNTAYVMSDRGSDNSSSQNLTFNSPMSLPRYSPLPPAPDVQSVASSGSFSLTSPIVARQRDAERNRVARDALNNFRLSMSTTTTNSRSTSSRLSSKAGTSSSITSFPVPALPPRTRTTRQMLIEEKIQLFQSKILLLQSRKISAQTAEYDAEMDRLGQRVERLKQIHESDWALDLTNVAPEGLHD